MRKNNFFFLLIILFASPVILAITLNDTGQISATKVTGIVHIQSEADIINAIREANLKHLPITIMGKQHSQGGQSLAQNAIVLNMLSFNKIIGIDIKKKQVTVQSGIVWSDLQNYINQYNLAIKSMQSPNIFTVGGSISVNAHGDDIRAGAVGNSIIAFHFILADGKKIYVTPNNYPELWKAVIGGYGLLGVITDVTLQLTENNYLISHYEETDLENFSNYFNEKILNNKNIVLFYAHLNITPGTNFLENMYVISYANTIEIPKKVIPLDNPDKWNALLTPTFNLSRHGNLGKKWRWNIERKIFRRFYNHQITRNNAMEKPVRFASNYHSVNDVDWLQEYFIPVNNLSLFIEKLRKIILDNNVNLLNVTIRYVPVEHNFLLAYSAVDCFAVVLYFNQNLAIDEIQHTQIWTQNLINAAFSVNGNYYLPYQPFATINQFQKGYPLYKQYLKIKRKYDPKNRFSNQFYLKYFLAMAK